MSEPRPSNAQHNNGPPEDAPRAARSKHDDANTYEARADRIADWRARLLRAVRLQERLQLLNQLGLTDAEIARAIPDGKARSVRRWRLEGVARGRLAGRWGPIDDLCSIIGFLLSDGTYDEEAVVAWLRSRRPELGHIRPLDALGAGRFTDAFNAAEALLAPAPAAATTGGPLTHPQVVV